jgi:hypothetical protein
MQVGSRFKARYIAGFLSADAHVSLYVRYRATLEVKHVMHPMLARMENTNSPPPPLLPVIFIGFSSAHV